MEKKKEKIVIGILLSICILLWFIQHLLSDQLYINSLHYDKTQKDLASLKKENMNLRDELLHLKSYTYLSNQAQKQGFIPATTIYLH